MVTLVIGTNTFGDAAAIDTYHEDRGNTAWAALSADARAVWMVKATDYINRTFSFVGTKRTAAQRLAWPRDDLFDEEGAPWYIDYPIALIEAEAELAGMLSLGTIDLSGVVTDDAALIEKTVGPITKKWDPSKRLRGEPVLSNIISMLSSLTTGQGGSGTLMRG